MAMPVSANSITIKYSVSKQCVGSDCIYLRLQYISHVVFSTTGMLHESGTRCLSENAAALAYFNVVLPLHRPRQRLALSLQEHDSKVKP